MRISEEKKAALLQYLLRKIEDGEKSLSKCVAEAFDLNQSTIHGYINELAVQNVIRRTSRGKYELTETVERFVLNRAEGDLNSDMYAYQKYLLPRISALPPNVQEMWGYAFTEMINNVMDHSEAEHAELTIRRNALDTAVTIADDGIGIFEKIRRHFQMNSLDDAVCELFKGRLTTDTAHHSGEGIFFSSKLMDSFMIVSGGKVFSRDKFDMAQLRELSDGRRGTTVQMKLSNTSQKHSYEVFDRYSDEDNRFTKTRIPLRMMFDSSPVSRSQAKRVCNRLDEFREITLDFDGLEWMGQGFAHQIFVVFQREHPNIRLIPIHMSETVEAMYRHVTERE